MSFRKKEFKNEVFLGVWDEGENIMEEEMTITEEATVEEKNEENITASQKEALLAVEQVDNKLKYSLAVKQEGSDFVYIIERSGTVESYEELEQIISGYKVINIEAVKEKLGIR